MNLLFKSLSIFFLTLGVGFLSYLIYASIYNFTGEHTMSATITLSCIISNCTFLIISSKNNEHTES
ncbi:MAG: hypothetical protein E7K85_18275 [Clostridium sp.]|uniref:hypothetical protein n=1 Tax=Clostridium TaxID=1485 RepID=UPI00232D7EAB|nr:MULTISPECIES: hypothetical protein [Clostridium]MDB2122307.1 hypothetical protein [Clostridium paraputrificum]MDU4429266.1 hypothetical protein [Clostridium sp.]MDU7462545.1 hypothetical protein [Clostridium sp.]